MEEFNYQYELNKQKKNKQVRKIEIKLEKDLGLWF